MSELSNACRMVFEAVGETGRLFVGFSGGMDSTVLTHAIGRAARTLKWQGQLIAVHVDHGLAGQSADWVEHCAAFAAEQGIEFVVERLELQAGPNLEARARAGRYEVFERLLEASDLLLLAHHLDDQDESVLLHLLQGRGLFGMPTRRPLGAASLLRPLLHLPRRVLEAYAIEQRLEWLDDPGNLAPELDRNFIRHQIMPRLHERFPELSQRLERVVARSRATDGALEEALGLGRNPLPLALVDGLSTPASVQVLRHWLVVQRAAAGVSDAALGDFLSQLGAAGDRQPCLTTAAGTLRRHRGQLYLVGPPPPLEAAYALAVPGTLDLPQGTLCLGLLEEGALLQVRGAVTVTFVDALEAGAEIRVRGHRRKVRELLRQAGLPPWQRDLQPLLVDDAGLLAIAGIAERDRDPAASGETLRLLWRPRATDGLPGAEIGEVR